MDSKVFGQQQANNSTDTAKFETDHRLAFSDRVLFNTQAAHDVRKSTAL